MADMNVNPASPLGAQDLARINSSLEQVNQGLQQVELAERAGIDVSQQKAQLQNVQERLTTIKNVYFPGQ